MSSEQLEYKIGALEIKPEFLPDQDNIPETARHRFLVEECNDVLSIYARSAQDDEDIINAFGLNELHVVGGGSLSTNPDNRLVLAGSSIGFQAIPTFATYHFAELIRLELEYDQISTTGIVAEPDMSDINPYWLSRTRAYDLE